MMIATVLPCVALAEKLIEYKRIEMRTFHLCAKLSWHFFTIKNIGLLSIISGTDFY